MTKYVVRNMASNATHLAELSLDQMVDAVSFGAKYTAVAAGSKAFCGVTLRDGVVMHPGTSVKCTACRHIEQHVEDCLDGEDPMELREQVVRQTLREHLGYTLTEPVIGQVGDAIMARLREIE